MEHTCNHDTVISLLAILGICVIMGMMILASAIDDVIIQLKKLEK